MSVETDRTRVWSFVVYPDSVPDGWIEALEKKGIQAAISPLHDQDLWDTDDEQHNPEHKAGTPKKPHYHVILYYNGVKTSKQVERDIAMFNGYSTPLPVPDVNGYNRYLCHLDQPTKAQYNPAEIIRLNGAACDLSKHLSPDQQDEAMNEMVRFIREHNLTEYSDFVFWCQDNNHDWFKLARKQTVFFKGLFSSIRHKK